MTDANRQSRETREKIPDTACRLFVEKGYLGTAVGPICRTAGANTAAANYHFGSKESLYQQAGRHAHDQLLMKIPPDGGVATGRPAPERLGGAPRPGRVAPVKAADGPPGARLVLRSEAASLLRRVATVTRVPGVSV